ncbi:Hypothetical protein FKW44_007158, partial [Caligus rogercresseyi]
IILITVIPRHFAVHLSQIRYFADFHNTVGMCEQKVRMQRPSLKSSETVYT